MGKDREYKKAVEAYWNGKSKLDDLEAAGSDIRRDNWKIQQEAGLNYVTVGDFAWYDHILNLSMMLGVIPARFTADTEKPDINTMFRMARGRAPVGEDAHACEMTKWFDTNYHYLVPEFEKEQKFRVGEYLPLMEHIKEAKEQGHNIKAVLTGPLTYLWLGKCADENFDKLSLIDDLCHAYADILAKVKELGVEWIQIDEPILALDLPQEWLDTYQAAYDKIAINAPNILLATYFGGFTGKQGSNFSAIRNLPIDGLHLDITRNSNWKEETKEWNKIAADKVLSLGLIDGRDVWRSDLAAKFDMVKEVVSDTTQRVWVGSSCSLQHCPVDLASENKLDDELKQWLAFARQKCREVALLSKAVIEEVTAEEQQEIDENVKAAEERRSSNRIHKKEVAERVAKITQDMKNRSSVFSERAKKQKEHLNLPAFPTTTIGSFPQTPGIRSLRGKFKRGDIAEAQYIKAMQDEITATVTKQEKLGLDVLVHGEPERNDMVEYFGELLGGVAVTSYGWVQSYGSRCVKPPIIYGDITRSEPMTVPWSSYAKEITGKPMKAMLTGPVTILCWSFVRDDISRAKVTEQIGLALRDEVMDLEQAGMKVIQIDEPALREGLPLRRENWREYLTWAVEAFRLAASGVKDETQIHTHMCYSEFNDIIDSIAAMDADVISIECSRSRMELLEVFDKFNYPNEIGPGVYDIHSPLVPPVGEMEELLEKAASKIPAERLWVNPDCGLKTRAWPETEAALKNMVAAAENMRAKHAL